jgi:hypothetical protein
MKAKHEQALQDNMKKFNITHEQAVQQANVFGFGMKKRRQNQSIIDRVVRDHPGTTPESIEKMIEDYGF